MNSLWENKTGGGNDNSVIGGLRRILTHPEDGGRSKEVGGVKGNVSTQMHTCVSELCHMSFRIYLFSHPYALKDLTNIIKN